MAFVAILTTNGKAQTAPLADNREAMSFGLKAGVNYSNVYDSESQNFVADSKFGFAGGFCSHSFWEIYWNPARAFVFAKRIQVFWNVSGKHLQHDPTTNYIDVPILFAVKPAKEVTLLFGPQFCI